LPIIRSLSTAALAPLLLQLYVYKTLSLMTIGKPEAAVAVDRLLMMDKRMPEPC
jgi:hypothetical protein